MAASRRHAHSSLIARLCAEPGRFRFFQAVRLIERQRARQTRRSYADGLAAIGEETDPRQRSVRFQAAMRLSFPTSEVDEVTQDGAGPPRMTVTFMGLNGPSAVLPQHYSVTLWREFRGRNTALRDFFDLFNDRVIAFFYRAWAKYRVPIAVERSVPTGHDGASETLRSLIGFATDRLAGRADIAEHALLHYAGFLSHFPRNAASLEALLCDYFKLPITVEPFDGRWFALPVDQRTRLSAAPRASSGFCRLSVDAVVGESYWDVESGFTISIGPIDYAAFASLMPDGATLRRLAALTQLYVSPELGIRVELCLRRDEVPPPQLDPHSAVKPLLGWNTWLRHYPMAHDARDASYRL